MRDYLNPASMVLFPAAKVSFNFLLQATDNYFPSLDRIKFKAAGCLSFLCLPLGVVSFHCYKLKMVVGLFVYQHLFSSRETKFQINLLRTHPRFHAATWPLLLPQVLRYPLGRDYSVAPPLSVERGNSWVAAAPPAVKRARVHRLRKLAGVFNSVNSNWMFLRKPAEWTFRASYVWLSKFRRLA